MAICPKCKEEITGLDHQKENYGACYEWLEGDELEFEVEEHNDDGAGSYSCPLCSADVATTEEEAIKLLKG